VATGGCATRASLERVRRDRQEVRARLADVQVSLDSINRRLDTLRTSVEDKTGGPGSPAARALEKRIADLEARAAQPAPSPSPTELGAAPAPTPGNVPKVPRTEAASIALRREDRQPATPADE